MAAKHEGLPLRALLSYGIGESAITVSMVVIGLFLLFFYTSVMGLPGTLAGIGIAAGLVWDAVIDPYIGYRSDRHRGALGKRHGYMLGGALSMGAMFWLLMSPPQGLGTIALFLWLLVTTLLFRFTSAIFRIPYLSLGAELSSDYHGRNAVVAVRSAFGLAGSLFAAALSFLVFFPTTANGLDPKLEYSGYARMGLAYGIAMTVAGLLSFAGTLQFRDSGSAVVPSTDRRFLSGFASAWQNDAFRSIWISVSLFFFGVVVNAAVAVHYYTLYVQIGDSTTLSRLQLCFYVGSLIGVVFWTIVGRRFDKRPLCIISLMGTASLMVLATVLFGDGHVMGTGDAFPLLAGNLLAGLFAGALWVLPGSMLADVADQDELTTGERREGLFFGLLNFGEKIAAGAALLFAGILLDVFVHLETGGTQDPTSVMRVGLLYGLLPAAALLGAAIPMTKYRLDRHVIAEIQRQLRGETARTAAMPAPQHVPDATAVAVSSPWQT